MVYAQTDDTERAYQYLQKALTLRPAYPEALNNLGVLYLRTRRRNDAVSKFEECIRIAPGFDEEDFLRGVFAQPARQHAARRAGTDDDEVIIHARPPRSECCGHFAASFVATMRKSP